MEPLFDPDLIVRNRERAFGADDAGAGFLLDIVAQELTERLAVVERRFETAVELHGMDGRVGRACLETGRIDQLQRVETSSHFARQGETLIPGPIEHLPLGEQSANLLLSPLALHLANDMPGLLIQMRRSLQPDGLLLAALPGAGTLGELRDVLLTTEIEISGGASPRVMPFADVRDMGGLLQRAGFALPVVDVETYTVRYDGILALMRDLKAMGMANPLAARSRKPLTRQFFLRAAELYAERYSDADGRIRASFSIIYMSGWAPHESQPKPLKPGSAKIRLADALGGKP
ncbi:methyltransferase domain-containing protein [Agrobacterium vitis]|uniref:methyltransferase domain-containing protein n=1 Tax=Agrobacterium vitis TaxID=373 RepID=UPI0015749867|nr:methyltransferase domain-containing protein [Agrobacterium vitis]NSZ17981.1 methyltransferase domain-containing protein [Agrobacterium vitis]QZO03730.1 methyltransferase domain-containing protein [Agrobacterium vitis]UJL88856.1 methyltransferase domain-containing protein [Agrobacterium vitis]